MAFLSLEGKSSWLISDLKRKIGLSKKNQEIDERSMLEIAGQPVVCAKKDIAPVFHRQSMEQIVAEMQRNIEAYQAKYPRKVGPVISADNLIKVGDHIRLTNSYRLEMVEVDKINKSKE